MTKDHTNLRLSENVSAKDTTMAWCAKTNQEEENTQATATDIVERVSPEMADFLGHELLFEIARTEVGYFLSLLQSTDQHRSKQINFVLLNTPSRYRHRAGSKQQSSQKLALETLN